MAVFGHDALGDVFLLRIFLVVVVPVQEHDDVRVLLNGAGVTQVREHGTLVLPLLVGTAELAEAQHRHVQLLGHNLQHPGDVADRLLAALTGVAFAAGGVHQLQVVDDHQPQVLDAAALGVHVRHGEHGVVVDADVRLPQGPGGLGHLSPVRGAQPPRQQPPQLHQPLRGQQAGDQLLLAHLQGEHRHRLLALLGHVQGHVQGEGALAHAGAGGQEHQVRAVQAVDLLVHGGKAAGQARQALLPGGQGVEPVQHRLEDLAHRRQVLGAAAPADGVDLLLRRLQGGLCLADALLDHAQDVPGGLGQPPQQGLVPDDGHVLHDVGAGGGDLHELDQVAPGGLRVVGAVFLHLLRHGDPVDGLGVAEHGVDGLEDVPVLLDIEVLRLELVHHVLDAVGVDEHGPQSGLLRLQGVGHLTGQQLVHGHGGGPPFFHTLVGSPLSAAGDLDSSVPAHGTDGLRFAHGRAGGENYLVSRIASILYGNMWGLPAPTPRGSLLDAQK